jgi:hypothetical protein
MAYNAVLEPADQDNFIENGVNAILTYVAPHKALAKQKRRFCCRPANLAVRKYTNRQSPLDQQTRTALAASLCTGSAVDN